MNKKLLSLYGLKWNPFSPDLPMEGLLTTPKIEMFCWRVEQGLAREGGFGLISGDPGTGKSVTLRLLAARLARMGDVVVRALAHPQSSLSDFYRELGDHFGVDLKPSNRWGGFKSLRERWKAHIDSTLIRPVLLIDEAQEMSTPVMNELRLLSSTEFDSRIILAVVMAGDGRLLERLRQDDLLPLGSRIRTRLQHDAAARDELMALLKHLIHTAGAPKLMTQELMSTICDHSLGTPRVMLQMANELLTAAAHREATQLDEKLYLEVFDPAKIAKVSGARERPRAAARAR